MLAICVDVWIRPAAGREIESNKVGTKLASKSTQLQRKVFLVLVLVLVLDLVLVLVLVHLMTR